MFIFITWYKGEPAWTHALEGPHYTLNSTPQPYVLSKRIFEHCWKYHQWKSLNSICFSWSIYYRSRWNIIFLFNVSISSRNLINIPTFVLPNVKQKSLLWTREKCLRPAVEMISFWSFAKTEFINGANKGQKTDIGCKIKERKLFSCFLFPELTWDVSWRRKEERNSYCKDASNICRFLFGK